MKGHNVRAAAPLIEPDVRISRIRLTRGPLSKACDLRRAMVSGVPRLTSPRFPIQSLSDCPPGMFIFLPNALHAYRVMCRCSTIGPNDKAGRKLRAPTSANAGTARAKRPAIIAAIVVML